MRVGHPVLFEIWRAPPKVNDPLDAAEKEIDRAELSRLQTRITRYCFFLSVAFSSDPKVLLGQYDDDAAAACQIGMTPIKR